ncbi:EAL domain-containing protein [Rhodoferax sp. WC2427]|uniref:EAL domain-containing protein n=1 Tax=Rhodoferax sp. WC2427 TaxID=3234144 RepID=UPI003467CA8B
MGVERRDGTVVWSQALQRRLRLWLQAIREAYVALLPVTVLGVMGNTVAQIPYPPYVQWMDAQFGPIWHALAMQLYYATLGLMGLLGAMVIAVRTTTLYQAQDRRVDRSVVTVSVVAASAFLLVVLRDPPDFQVLGYASAFQSILVGVAVAELMRLLGRWLPSHTTMGGVDGGVSLQSALHMTGTAALTLLAVWLAHGLWRGLSDGVAGPLLGQGWHWFLQHRPGGDVLNFGMVLLNQLLWMVGINGGQFLYAVSSASGLVAPATALHSDHLISLMFLNTFVHNGGAGATWGLILYCVTRGKDASLRRLAWYSVLPALLNMNELLLFGIPLVLSRTLLLPFIAAPLLNCLIATLAYAVFGMPLDGQPVIWSTPVFISGYLMTGGWGGVAVQALCLFSSTLVYAPFVRQLESARLQRNQAYFKSALDVLMSPEVEAQSGNLDRADAVGEVARCLVRDFRADIGSSRVTLAYQPQHDVQGRVVGLESLLRWTHASHGPVPTAALINVAEECDLIHLIGAWVVQRVCEDLAVWQKAGLTGFTVSVNMSPVQLHSSTWVQTVADAMRTHGIQSKDIDIEITEGRTLANTAQADKTLADLQAMGLSLSMDDFGMGCTSLLYMHRFKVHAIKLDGVLTRKVLHNPVDQDIIRCVCRLGHSQGVYVVAEFVEQAAQRDMLQALGCDFFQGWLYSPAMPADRIPAYLKAWHKATQVLPNP